MKLNPVYHFKQYPVTIQAVILAGFNALQVLNIVMLTPDQIATVNGFLVLLIGLITQNVTTSNAQLP